jgi:hypothetical protein
MARLNAFLDAAVLALMVLPPALCLGAAVPTGSARALLQTRASCPLVGGNGAYGEAFCCCPSVIAALFFWQPMPYHMVA